MWLKELQTIGLHVWDTQNKKGVAHRPGTGEENPVIPGIFFFLRSGQVCSLSWQCVYNCIYLSEFIGCDTFAGHGSTPL